MANSGAHLTHLEVAKTAAPNLKRHAMGGFSTDTHTSIAHSLIAIAEALAEPPTPIEIDSEGVVRDESARFDSGRVTGLERLFDYNGFEVLRRLVALKDGPRDDTYRQEKDLVWEEARKLIKEREARIDRRS